MTLSIAINEALCLNCNREQLSSILLMRSMRKSGRLLVSLICKYISFTCGSFLAWFYDGATCIFLQVCLARKDASA